MWDYYTYLWRTTWPYVSVFCGIWGFVLCRMAWKLWTTWRYNRKVGSFLWLAGKAFIWAVVLGVYTKLLLFSQPDWLSQPGYMLGTVEGKAYDSEASSYVLEVRNDEVQNRFNIDLNVYEQLNVNDQVNLLYLPVKREVVRCELVERVLVDE